jgi:hypothetical protein
MYKLIVSITGTVFLALSAAAQQKPISGEFNKKPPSGSILIAVGDSGRSSTGIITGKKFRVTPPAAAARLYLLQNNRVSAQLVLSRCKNRKGTKTIDAKSCSKVEVYTTFKAGKKLGSVNKIGSAYVVRSASLTSVLATQKASASNFIPVGVTTLGLGGGNKASIKAVSALVDTNSDSDLDGLVDALDIDDNGNGIIDNYDSAAPATSAADSFKVFSNLKLDLDQSLNLHATNSLTVPAIDAALQSTQTLAIQVAGNTGETSELDCGVLSYCSSGGTGQNNNQPFPGAAGGSFDADGDGFGSITRGGTGDFQLITKAKSSTIGAGDTLIQRIKSSDETERHIPGLLNFVFNSTPALKSIAVNGAAAQNIDYSANPRLGSRQSCIQAPASGNVVLNITGWRPQRPGLSSAGEAQFVDIGRSIITIDIPNGPVSVGAPGGGSSGPGNCLSSAYSIPGDTNLTIVSDGIQDGKNDSNADSSNTYNFTVDLTSCLNNARSGAINWPANSELYIDLQFRSKDGDNAAQKFCVARGAA